MASRYSITIPSRTTLATLLLVSLIMTTGCLGFITGDGPLSVESEPVAVSNSTVSEANYEVVRDKTITVDASVSVADQERTVEAKSHFREYGRDFDILGSDMTAARFVALSTPKAEVAGEPLNPIGDRSNDQLVNRLLQSYDGIKSVEFVKNRSVTSLGEDRTVATYEATAQVSQDVEIPVTLHTATFAHKDDYITILALYPKQLDEQPNIDKFLEELEHPV